jgi:CBS domain containing-hemolysin-like protein
VASATLSVGEVTGRMSQEKQTLAFLHRAGDERHIIGFVSLSLLLKQTADLPVGQFVQVPVWVPETVKIADLLSYLLNEGQSIACVLDESGSFSGIFYLSEGIRRILNTASVRMPSILPKIPLKSMVFSGMTAVESLQGWIPASLEKMAVERRTLNGLITHYLGRIPLSSEQFAIDGWKFYIIAASATRTESVLIRKKDSL